MKTKRLFLLLMVAAFTVTLSVQAQPTDSTKSAHRAFFQEIVRYQQQQVWPVLREKRKVFDKKLTKAEHLVIANARTSALQYRSEKALLKTQQTPPTDAQKAAFLAAREANHAHRARLLEIAKKHENDLQAVKEKLQPFKTKWINDLLAIAAKHGISPQDLEKKRGPKANAIRRHLRVDLNPVSFLLLDPNKTAKNPDAAPETATLLKISPNPVSSSATLTFDLLTAGPVKIVLVNQQGRVVHQTIEKNLKAGPQAEIVQLAKLPQGLYFYRITTASGTQTVRFLKQ